MGLRRHAGHWPLRIWREQWYHKLADRFDLELNHIHNPAMTLQETFSVLMNASEEDLECALMLKAQRKEIAESVGAIQYENQVLNRMIEKLSAPTPIKKEEPKPEQYDVPLLPSETAILNQFNGEPKHYKSVDGNRNTVAAAVIRLTNCGMLNRLGDGFYRRVH